MILLEVQKYCHTCPNFEAITIDCSTLEGSRFIVTCNHAGMCDNIKKYLQEEQKR